MKPRPALLAIAGFALLAQATAAAAGGDRLSFDGLGPARIGMTREALEAALGGPLSRDDATQDGAICEMVHALRGDDSVSYMLRAGRLARIDVDTDRVVSVSGIGLDATHASVMAAYPGRITTRPHAYGGPQDKYLTLLSRDGSRGMRFELIGGKVMRFYAGTAEAIRFIEGCQ